MGFLFGKEEREMYWMLDSEDFACLVRGGVLHCGNIKLAFRDIGFAQMRNEIDHAELGKDIYKDYVKDGFNMGGHYILDEKKDLVEVDLLTWAKWFESIENRRVASDHINDYHISTVFLGINHSYHDKGEPLVYETMVFSPKGDDCYMTRYHTWNEAELGHIAACDWVRNGACEDGEE